MIGGGKSGRPDINKRVEFGAGDLGPGAYDDGKDFGKNVRGHGFGKPRPEKTEIDNRDYGFDPDKAFKQTRHKSPGALINKKTPARPSTWARTDQADTSGPG